MSEGRGGMSVDHKLCVFVYVCLWETHAWEELCRRRGVARIFLKGVLSLV